MSAQLQPHPDYEVVIGLEVHVHLRTASKLFSPAPVRYGDPPNHDTHPIDLGMPGVLPVLNRRVVELGIRAALATHCKVHPQSVFARKNYFYPDLPKGYQISQYEDPLATGGWLDIEVSGCDAPIRVGLTRIHIEEDAGKSIHDAAIAGDDGTHVDLNRAGVPLLEIVSEPDLRSPEQAAAYLRKLRELLRWRRQRQPRGRRWNPWQAPAARTGLPGGCTPGGRPARRWPGAAPARLARWAQSPCRW